MQSPSKFLPCIWVSSELNTAESLSKYDANACQGLLLIIIIYKKYIFIDLRSAKIQAWNLIPGFLFVGSLL